MEHWLEINYWIVQFLSLMIEMIAIAIVFLMLERIWPIQKDISFNEEKRTEVWLLLLNQLLVGPAAYAGMVFITVHMYSQYVPHQFFNDEINSWPLILQILLAALILDFSTYVRHRLMHMKAWRVHAIHHSTEHINWLTAYRLHPIEMCVAMFFDLTVLHLIGFSGEGMVIASQIMFAMNLFVHSNIHWEWPGFLRYMIGSPNLHRWHHARTETEAFDKNFGVLFPFIDKAFGTFYHPKGKLPESYGIYQREDEIPINHHFSTQLLYPFYLRPSKKD